MTTGLDSALIVPISGMRDLEVGQDLEQERLELVVGPVDLVDQQHRAGRPAGPPPAAAAPAGTSGRRAGRRARSPASRRPRRGLRQRPDLQHLPGVVPLVQRLAGGDALVALQPDEPAAEDGGEHLRDLRLAHADLAFEQHGPAQRERHEQGGGQPAVGQVAAVPQVPGELGDGCWVFHRCSGRYRAQPRCTVGGLAVSAASTVWPGRSMRSRRLPAVPSLPSRSSRARHAAARSVSSPAA